MKRILCITENLGSGGAEQQLTGLVVMLKEAGYTVRFVTYIEKQFYESYLQKHNIDYVFIKNGQNKFIRLNSIRKIIREFKPDVVISFSPSVNLTLCLFKLIGYKFKLIVSERSHTHTLTIRHKLIFNLYRLTESIGTNSHAEMENLARLAPALKSKLKTITNFIDTDKFTPATEQRIHSSNINIISVGRIIAVKNILNYIKTVKIINNQGYSIKATWVGANYDNCYYQQCINLIKELSLEGVFYLQSQTEKIVDEYQICGVERNFRPVADYSMPNASDKAVRIIISYTDYIKRMVRNEQ